MVGTTIFHYKILEKIGQGGMGEVFLAQDTSLDRKVALKFLPEDLQEDPTARKRFLREAKSSAALDHPYICHIHEVGESDGKDFIAMEYVEGQTLKDKLASGPLPLKQALETAVQIAGAMEKAHEKKIVHRDLKPSNIMLTPQGHVKVMDFGLAKQLIPTEGVGSQEQALTALTKTGVTLGTLAYMSPEQLRGEEVDTRSDVFSFGVLLYEMMAGVNPFLKPQRMETASAILRDEPSPLSSCAPEVPERLEHIVKKMLPKQVDDRYESAREVRVELEGLLTGAVPFIPARPRLTRRRWLALAGLGVVATLATFLALDVGGWRDWLEGLAGVSGGPRIQSLAVLPLDNLSGDRDQGYFAAGMHEALITDLAKLGGFKRVIRYQQTEKSLPEIAQELGVDAVITGSVLREGDRVRITAQLINATTQELLWANRYERQLGDVLSLQNEIVEAITREMNLQLTSGEQARLASARTVNPEAHEAYLRGQFHWRRLSPADLETALGYFELALEKDPDYALAYTGISRVWAGRQQRALVSPREATPKAKAAAVKAIELDNTLAETHHALAIVRTWSEWDWEGGEIAFQRAIELNPNYPEARAYYSDFLTIMGRHDEAMAQIERALELDPFNALYQALYSNVLLGVRRYDDAIAQSRKAFKMSPGLWFAQGNIFLSLHLKGAYEEALAEQKKLIDLLGDSEVAEALDRGYAQGGYRGAMRLAAETLAARSRRTHTLALVVSGLYLRAGENDLALEWLERAFADRDPNLPYLGGPHSDSLRDDPRFQDLMRRMNLPL